jgi:hypothetical protein
VQAQIIAERDQWIQHAKNAVWADSEEVKLLAADNARLRDALAALVLNIDAGGATLNAVHDARAALTGKEPSHE